MRRRCFGQSAGRPGPGQPYLSGTDRACRGQHRVAIFWPDVTSPRWHPPSSKGRARRPASHTGRREARGGGSGGSSGPDPAGAPVADMVRHGGFARRGIGFVAGGRCTVTCVEGGRASGATPSRMSTFPVSSNAIRGPSSGTDRKVILARVSGRDPVQQGFATRLNRSAADECTGGERMDRLAHASGRPGSCHVPSATGFWTRKAQGCAGCGGITETRGSGVSRSAAAFPYDGSRLAQQPTLLSNHAGQGSIPHVLEDDELPAMRDLCNHA